LGAITVLLQFKSRSPSTSSLLLAP